MWWCGLVCPWRSRSHMRPAHVTAPLSLEWSHTQLGAPSSNACRPRAAPRLGEPAHGLTQFAQKIAADSWRKLLKFGLQLGLRDMLEQATRRARATCFTLGAALTELIAARTMCTSVRLLSTEWSRRRVLRAASASVCLNCIPKTRATKEHRLFCVSKVPIPQRGAASFLLITHVQFTGLLANLLLHPMS